MGALRTGKNDFQALWLGRQSLGKGYLNPLVARASHMQARRCCLRLQSFQSRGADSTWSGCNSRLTRRGFVVARPCH